MVEREEGSEFRMLRVTYFMGGSQVTHQQLGTSVTLVIIDRVPAQLRKHYILRPVLARLCSDEISPISFKRIAGGKHFDIDVEWFGKVLEKMGQHKLGPHPPEKPAGTRARFRSCLLHSSIHPFILSPTHSFSLILSSTRSFIDFRAVGFSLMSDFFAGLHCFMLSRLVYEVLKCCCLILCRVDLT